MNESRLDVLDEARFRTLDLLALVVITGVCLLCSSAVLFAGNLTVGAAGYFVVWLMGVVVVVSDWRHRVKNWRIRQLEDEIEDLKADWREP